MINKRKIIEILSHDSNISLEKASNAMDIILDHIRHAIKNDQRVSIAKFGVFTKKIRKGRTCRNPQTGEKIQTKDMNLVRFRPAKEFRNLINS